MSVPLLPRIAAGDRAAVDEFITRYGALVWSLTRRHIANKAEAEEAVQEIFLELWKGAERFDEQIASEVTFVAMVARRRLIDFRRKKQRTISTIAFSADLEEPATEDRQQSPISDEAKWARQQMSQLRPVERQVLELTIDKELSHSQIAELLGIPLGTVKSTARRGLQRLRELCLRCPPHTAVEGASS